MFTHRGFEAHRGVTFTNSAQCVTVTSVSDSNVMWKTLGADVQSKDTATAMCFRFEGPICEFGLRAHGVSARGGVGLSEPLGYD